MYSKKKKILFISLFSLIILASTIHFANASFSSVFGGKVQADKATRISELEKEGYTCIVPGQTFQLSPLAGKFGMPVAYFISAATISRTKNALNSGQKIIGRYEGKTTITCERIEPPDIQKVDLDTIGLWGNSKK